MSAVQFGRPFLWTLRVWSAPFPVAGPTYRWSACAPQLGSTTRYARCMHDRRTHIAISKYYVEANALFAASAEVVERWEQLAQQDIHIRERFRLKFDELRLKLDELERKLTAAELISDSPVAVKREPGVTTRSRGSL